MISQRMMLLAFCLLASVLWADPVRVQHMDGGGNAAPSQGMSAGSGGAQAESSPRSEGGGRVSAQPLGWGGRTWRGGGAGRWSRTPAWNGGHTRVVRQWNTPMPRYHATIARNPAVIRSVESVRRVEVVPNHYYWHTVDGFRYCHYYGRGIHWYGYYYGPHFYWTRYDGNHWWWYDAHWNHWAFWWDGFWWWPGPAGVIYVYVNDEYVPYEPGVVAAPAPDIPASPSEVSASNDTTRNSPDGTRMVQIVGPRREAFLYDTSSGRSVFLKYLGRNVAKVRYSGGTLGQPLKILVDFKNGQFTLFDAEGNSSQASTENNAPAETPDSPPPAPPDVQSE